MHYIIILFSLLFLYSPINSKTRKVPITSKQQQVQPPQSAQLKIMQPAPVSPAQRTQKLAPVKQIRITKRPTRKRTVRIARSKTTKSTAVSPAITPPVSPVAPAIIPPIAQAPVAIPASTQTPPSAQQTSTISLTSYNYNSASVLPIIKENNELFVILGQEALGDDKGTYDDFGGDRDFGEKHPIETAAREFHEEAILSQTAQMTLRNVRYHIDLAQPNTEVIIAYERTDRGKTRRNVTYITDFTQYAQQLFNTFYQARSKTKDQHSLEKDRIAKLKWTDLSDAIKRIPRGKPVRVVVDVLNPQTLKFEPELVVLRRFFVAKMRLYIENAPYKEGLNSKIRFYTQQ